MSRFIVVKKKDIILYLMLFFLIIFVWISLLHILRSSSTFSYVTPAINTKDKFDLTGDGSLDSVIYTKKNNYYVFKVKCSNIEYQLKDSQGHDILIDADKNFQPTISYLDLTRNNIPDILIMGLKDNTPITYIISWQKNAFINVLTTDNNIVGILNSDNSRTPEILFTFSYKGDETTKGIILSNNVIKDTTVLKPKIPSLGVVQNFIDLIQLTYELDDAPGIFTPTIASEELGLLWNLDKSVCKYSFKNAFFYDSSWNSNCTPTHVDWILSFDKTTTIDNKESHSEFTLYVTTELDSFGDYKISKIQK